MGEFLEAEGEAASEAAVQTENAGVGVALERVRARRGGKRTDDAADRFLEDQRGLIAEQRRHLHEQMRHMGLDRWSKRLRLALQAMTIALGLAVAGGLAWMAWDAAHADGLVVEAFSVPPDLAAQGATGPVVAREVLDYLRELDRGANSLFEVKTSDAFTQGTKIELPETGLSLGEVQKALRDWLGHETHLSGEVLKTPTGLKVIARTELGETATAEGPPDQLAALTGKVAEQIFAKARPNIVAELYIRQARVAEGAARQGRLDDARRLLDTLLAASDDAAQISLAEDLLGLIDEEEGHLAKAIPHFQATTASPDRRLAAVGAGNLSNAELLLGHTAAARAAARRSMELISQVPRTRANAADLDAWQSKGLYLLSDYRGSADLIRPIMRRHLAGRGGDSHRDYALQLAFIHDPSSRAIMDIPNTRLDAALEDWPAVIRDWNARPDSALVLAQPAPQAGRMEALARLDRFAEADAIGRTLPADCVPCFGVRGVVAALEGDPARSEREFAAALRLDPKQPDVLVRRGRVRLARGEVEPARADFEAASASAPRWADPLEAWGEALLAKGDAKAAAAKFAEAQHFAPRWGRLHLKWGEALAKQGKAAEARAQFATAAALDLTLAERAELAAQKV